MVQSYSMKTLDSRIRQQNEIVMILLPIEVRP